jgi:hypothetical protein
MRSRLAGFRPLVAGELADGRRAEAAVEHGREGEHVECVGPEETAGGINQRGPVADLTGRRGRPGRAGLAAFHDP